jgi:threonine/homoserine/homoserine lactone efflux protein
MARFSSMLMPAQVLSLGSCAMRPTSAARRHTGSRVTSRAALRQGVWSNLGNPKMLAFFTSLLPQFASSFAGLLALGLAFCAMTLVWLTAYSLVVARAGALFRRARVRRATEAVTGTVLIALGVRLATEQR